MTWQVIYFEFLDVSDFNLPTSVPRISLWTTEIVSKFTELDAINEDHYLFGRKPVSTRNICYFLPVYIISVCSQSIMFEYSCIWL